MPPDKTARLAVDIGGTFTDIAIQLIDSSGSADSRRAVTAKTPTTKDDPVAGVLTGVRLALAQASLEPGDIATVIHGTTLATNALIEGKGARVGMIGTAGFRDILEIAYERRYDQYDIFLEKPESAVPRERCLTIAERVSARGEVLMPLDEAALPALLDQIAELEIESLAVGLLHSYANPAHEERLGDLIAARRPDLTVTLSSEVCPEVREYDRLCTAVANAAIKPLMSRYLKALAEALEEAGFDCPLFIMTSGGGMTTLETALRFPIRLVESGPSGGALYACRVARACGADRVVSFDMGGTTAKLCLIDEGEPQRARQFEIARAARFIKGSGLPVRIPVIEMIEIGAGGGSIVSLDNLGRIQVGPRSAGAEPGPACYGRGGSQATVTDADLTLGFLEPAAFAEGRLQLDEAAAATAVEAAVGQGLGLSAPAAAHGIAQMVDETMANAARVHAAETGKDLRHRSLVVFGGNGPLHASRLADKIGVDHIIVPPDPGVGSAVGFLTAPVSYEIVRSLYLTLEAFDPERVNGLFRAMLAEADKVVAPGAGGRPLIESRRAFMRYKGQGHEIEIVLPDRDLTLADVAHLGEAYEARYRDLFHRSVPGMVIEIMTWALTLATAEAPPAVLPAPAFHRAATAQSRRGIVLEGDGRAREVPLFRRADLAPGDGLEGPALIVEAQTTTLVGAGFAALVGPGGHIHLERRGPRPEATPTEEMPS